MRAGLWPWDHDRLFALVRKTGRLLVAQAAVRVRGLAAEAAPTVVEELGRVLKAPVKCSA